MHYEHLVQINDPLFTLLDPLTPAQLWQGLVARAHHPQLFIPALEHADVTVIDAGNGPLRLERRLNFGPFQVSDVVTLQQGVATVTEVAAGPTWPASRMTISIEQPEDGGLYLRFLYQWEADAAGGELDGVTIKLREKAYYAADMDTVQRIRELVQRGDIDGSTREVRH